MRDITPRPIRKDQRMSREAARGLCVFCFIMGDEIGDKLRVDQGGVLGVGPMWGHRNGRIFLSFPIAQGA